ncbi:hypothetical protein BUALT_Bualt07G0038200 [Buddleja alternifolia]|uniref:Uncharacterized protein n=1 Tax=Buddleja alternifolia TaxID=168488 RepID=A0AAV6X9A3_9LAMI|nr:hypothetical protein BUALT_Bualt07G0038200 [Buddleja alternifolia]
MTRIIEWIASILNHSQVGRVVGPIVQPNVSVHLQVWAQFESSQFVRVEGTDILAFWEPCPRIEHENLPRGKISSMLSKAGVPLHKQEFMVDRISGRADEIANADYNKDKKVLPMIVSISVVACFCYDTAVC